MDSPTAHQAFASIRPTTEASLLSKSSGTQSSSSSHDANPHNPKKNPLEDLPIEIFQSIITQLSFENDTFLNFMLTNKNIYKYMHQHEHQICRRIITERHAFVQPLLLVQEEVHDDYAFDSISKLCLQIEDVEDVMSRIGQHLTTPVPEHGSSGLITPNEKQLLYAGLFIIRRSWFNRITYGSVAMEEYKWMQHRSSKLEIWLPIRFTIITLTKCWKSLLTTQTTVRELWGNNIEQATNSYTSFVIENTIRRSGFEYLKDFLIDDQQFARDPVGVTETITAAKNDLLSNQSTYAQGHWNPGNYRACRVRLIDDLIPQLHDREKQRQEYQKLPPSKLNSFYDRNGEHTDFSPFHTYLSSTMAAGYEEDRLENLIDWEETINTETTHRESIWKDRRDEMTLHGIMVVYAELDVCVRNGWGVFRHDRSRYLVDPRFI